MVFTPAEDIFHTGKRVLFRDVKIGEEYECNGNVWRKQSTRTAAGVWPDILPKWSHFGPLEVCHAVRNE